MREKDLSVLKKEEILFNSEVITYDDFTSLNDAEIEKNENRFRTFDVFWRFEICSRSL